MVSHVLEQRHEHSVQLPRAYTEMGAAAFPCLEAHHSCGKWKVEIGDSLGAHKPASQPGICRGEQETFSSSGRQGSTAKVVCCPPHECCGVCLPTLIHTNMDTHTSTLEMKRKGLGVS